MNRERLTIMSISHVVSSLLFVVMADTERLGQCKRPVLPRNLTCHGRRSGSVNLTRCKFGKSAYLAAGKKLIGKSKF